MIFEKRAAPALEAIDEVNQFHAGGTEPLFADLLDADDGRVISALTWLRPETAYDQISEMVARKRVHGLIGGDICAELFLLPILTFQDDIEIHRKDVWSQALPCLRQTLASWFWDSGRNIVFDGIYWMEWIMAWQPYVVRRHLERAVGQSSKAAIQFQAPSIALPDAAPRLAFVILARIRFKDWPKSPIFDPVEDARLKEIASQAMYLRRSGRHRELDRAPIVLSPAPWRRAVVAGLRSWLEGVHSSVGIKGWSIEPQAEPRDQVDVRLWLDDVKVAEIRFAVRLYQVGMTGLREVLLCLARLAPCADQHCN